jgi:Fe-S-cluster containining protein
MTASGKNDPSIKANLSLSIYGERLDISVDIPTGQTRTRKMLPMFQSVCGSIVGSVVKHAEKDGRSVSCTAGCGACCRQMVPISPTEAMHLKQVVDKMPDEQRLGIIGRFEDGKAAMNKAGLLERLSAEVKPKGAGYKKLGLSYFDQGVACPFLENESCSIHPDRPLVCREYLVVSPAENCARRNGQPIEALKIPAEASKALTALNGPVSFTNWIPLILALEWAESNPEETATRRGTEIAREFFGHLTRNDIPEAP